MKHTPGPWYVGTQNDCLFVTNHRPPTGDYQPTLKVICSVGALIDDAANARLIAAAPELLEACKKAAEAFHEGGDYFVPEYVALRAAIAKAEGAQ